MRRTAWLAIVAALIAITIPAGAGAHATHRARRTTGRTARRRVRCRGAGLRPVRSDIGVVTRSTLCLIDRLRRAHHLPALQMSRPLRRIASGQSADMTIGHYFGDASLSGQSPMARILGSGFHGDRRLRVGQNIAWATGGKARPAAIVRAWMASPPHREIMLDAAYRVIGVGIHRGTPSAGAGGATYTILLAS